jgi:signal transduction histidine kinase
MLKVLAQLEWILLAIALLASFSPAGRLRPPLRTLGVPQNPPLPPGFIQLQGAPFPIVLSVGAIACLVILGLMGQRLPDRPPWLKLLYTLAGFMLSWLTLLLGGRGATVFPPLLLIVVIRGCLLFPQLGRWAVALLAFGSFVLMQSLAVMRLKPLGIELMRLPRLPGPRRLPPEIIDGLLWNAALNASLLFGLVLTFVLLTVGTLLNEKESRDRLALANQQLRRYALLAEDQATLQERNRIAREMHDSVGHSLTAQSIQLENVARLLHNDPHQAEKRLQQARQLGKEALQNVRHSVASLRSHPLQGKPLITALQELAAEFHRNTHIEIQLQDELTSGSSEFQASQAPSAPVPSLPLEIETALYRIVQEGLTNITKHAQATCVQLSLRRTPERLCLELSDNGVGFDPSQNTTGFGLQGMAERIRAVGGTFRLKSQAGAGSQIAFEIPYTSSIL